MDKIIEVRETYSGKRFTTGFFDPGDKTRRIIGHVEIRIPKDGGAYIASEDNLGRNLLPNGFCDNQWCESALESLPDEVYDALGDDPMTIPVRDRFGRSLFEYMVLTPYGFQ